MTTIADTSKTDHYIIGIGFSAGGLEPLKTFFDHTPHDGVSYIIIQHLPPDYKSKMAEILGKHSKLRIFEVEDNMAIEPNSVYLMPERKNVTINEGKLIISDNQTLQPNTAIDVFLDSLAAEYGNRSIGVILSGAGSDGSKGIASIKKAGGMVMVQNPETAKYDSMPNHAIESGTTDFILAPEQMPFEILNYLRQARLTNKFSEKINEKDEIILVEILKLIQNTTPLDFTDYKRPTIVRRILRRMSKKNIDSFKNYLEFLENDSREIESLSKEFLISVTKFFRDEDAFEKIRDEVIPDIIQNKLIIDTLKVWVIGCATGEEAYSLAILIKEHLTEIKKDLEVKIFATDIDKEAINIASKGVYPENINLDISPARIENFFQKEGNKYKVRDNIRKMVIFAHHDIIKQTPYGKIDLISCRNLLIYLNPLLQKKLLATIHFCLNLGGYLFLGSSESIGEFKKFFSETDKKYKIYKNIEAAKTIGNREFMTTGIDIKKQFDFLPNVHSSKVASQNNFSDLIIHSLLKYSDFSGACIDENFNIIQPLGDLKKYLLPKILNFNLLEVVPEELSIAIGGSLREAMREHKEVTIKDVGFTDANFRRTVTIQLIPFLSEDKFRQKVIIVLFRDSKFEEITGEDVEIFDKKNHSNRYITELEKELKETKDRLEKAFEALEIANDNSQAYSEELISGNEEMQSSNEELQSINEELQTVNNEYQTKIKELAELNDDLTNYFRSSLNAQLFVDKDLIIRKFTAETIKQINLVENDLGRSLSNISTNIKFEGFIEDIVKVISDSDVRIKEIQTKDGKWYQMTISPYIRRQINQIDGAIITFNDITTIKKAQDVLAESNASVLRQKNEELTRINNDLDSFIYAASHDLRAPISNMEGLLNTMIRDFTTDNEEIKPVINMFRKSVDRLKKTINELTEISRTQKSIEEDIQNIDLSELYNEVLFNVNDLILENKAKIEVDFKDSPEIKFSRKNMRSILYNFLSNAIKYRSPKRQPEISIKSSPIDNFILIRIEDNGLGIKEENKERIFNMFKRFHDHVEGTGIGLYIVKKIIDNAGGKIELESTLDKGSVFKIYIPMPKPHRYS
ncbi:MAG TPA: CheR family methyltransferase [Cytophagaceae bacterium]|jgi:two-component system CheB/CheR fusion protein|nr:CheR family methyltransferase [Cytophagaceae bacterium]